MKWRLMRANLVKCKLTSRIRLHFMLDPVQPLEYETGPFQRLDAIFGTHCLDLM